MREGGDTMRAKRMLLAGAAVLALVGSVSAAALAADKPSKTPTAATTTQVDTDTMQQGDQTSPDTPGQTDEVTGNDESSSESSGESDGPGGHADPAGQNVDHRSNGEE
jgi:opacity protein-like surface antigen